MRKRWWLLALFIALAGCSGETSESGDDGTDGAQGTDGTDGTDATDGTNPPACTETEPSDFLVLFGYRYRVAGTDQYDINAMYPVQKYEPQPLTEFSLKTTGKTCAYGCSIDDDIEWIAVNGAPPDASGFDFQMGRFNSCLEVNLVKGAELADKTHFAFAGNYVYYSEKNDGCNGPSCQYSISRLNLDNPSQVDLLVPAFPPQDDPDWVNGDSTYRGHFTVSPDGESLVILSPTIRSQRIYFRTEGTLHEVDYLCENRQNDTCVGAGSQYSDRDPVAISPDSKTVVLFSLVERALRVRRYSTENPDDQGQSALLSVASIGGDVQYDNVACGVKEDWQFTHVGGTPQFTPDGNYVVFIGRSECDAGGKAHTNIYKIDWTWIGDLTPVEEHELINLTQNPTGNVAANIEINSMALSPDGQHVVFTGTPSLNDSWQPIPDEQNRHESDSEVYIVSICGGTPTQLTADVSYLASGARAVPVPDMSLCPTPPIPAP